uniref:HORMA domain-containing protein 1-like n=1 Tax=Pundamilia nyererei TaxID=303518 RepID=A0A3B4GZ63_9CICH
TLGFQKSLPMMVVAVSSITYLRGIFPEDAYRSRYLEGEHSEKLARSLIKSVFGEKMYTYWMLMGCFDALEKQYVSRRIIESYHFKFRYSAKGPEMDILRNNGIKMQVTMDDTKKALVLLIRKLFLLMQNLDVLPSNVYLTMKLYYYDEITPADYQPPGFKEGECDSLWFEGVAVNFRVGEVETPFHTLKIAVSAEQDRVEKLQKGNHLGETKQVSQGAFPEKEIEKVGYRKGTGLLFRSLGSSLPPPSQTQAEYPSEQRPSYHCCTPVMQIYNTIK